MRITGFHTYIVKRLAYTILTVWLVATIVFVATAVLPGSAAQMILGRVSSPEALQALEAELGLNQPIHIRYFSWVGDLLTGDAGESLSMGKPVLEIVLPRLVVSLTLAITALTVTVLLAIPLGVVSAVKQNSYLDRSISSISYLGVSLPEFVTGTVLIMLLGGPVFGIFPSSGYVPLSESVQGWITHMILPVVTLMIIMVAHIYRQTRQGVIEVLHSEYIRSARLKGLGETTVLFKHGLRNGLLPTITVIALNFGWLLGGLVVVEEIFVIPGIGRLVVHAIANRDIPLLQFLVIIIALAYTLANLMADLLYGYFDPRIKYGGES